MTQGRPMIFFSVGLVLRSPEVGKLETVGTGRGGLELDAIFSHEYTEESRDNP